MTTTVLDRVETLQSQAQSRRLAEWLKLVTAYVDNDLPAAEEVRRIFDLTGKWRDELERDGALLREYRALEAEAATIPAKQRHYDVLARDLSAAIAKREEAEKALRAAQEQLSRTNDAHTAIGMALRELRKAEVAMRDPKFSPILTGAPAVSREVLALRAEIRSTEATLTELAARITAQKQTLASLDGQLKAMDNSDLRQEEKNAERDKLHARIQAAQSLLDRQGDEQYCLQRELAALRRELKAAKP
jgi:chromosome segregation ATPase